MKRLATQKKPSASAHAAKILRPMCASGEKVLAEVVLLKETHGGRLPSQLVSTESALHRRYWRAQSTQPTNARQTELRSGCHRTQLTATDDQRTCRCVTRENFRLAQTRIDRKSGSPSDITSCVRRLQIAQSKSPSLRSAFAWALREQAYIEPAVRVEDAAVEAYKAFASRRAAQFLFPLPATQSAVASDMMLAGVSPYPFLKNLGHTCYLKRVRAVPPPLRSRAEYLRTCVPNNNVAAATRTPQQQYIDGEKIAGAAVPHAWDVIAPHVLVEAVEKLSHTRAAAFTFGPQHEAPSSWCSSSM